MSHTTVAVSDENRERLKDIRDSLGFGSYDETVEFLMEVND